jgi:hypothetical protein
MENNKLIAEFMETVGNVDFHDGKGFVPIYWYEGINGGKTPYKEDELEYHKSWDWLIPVVEKIESLDLKEYGYKWEGIDGETEYNNGSICVEIEQNRCWIYMNLQLDPFHTFNEKTHRQKFDTKIEAVYAAVVEFIEYYNILIKNQDK